MHLRVLTLMLALCALLLAACGDDEGSSGGGGSSDDEAKITKVVQDGLTSTDVKVVCEGSLSANLLKTIYTDTANCHKVEADTKPEDAAKSVDVSAIEVDGDTATATVALTGGNNDGAKGPLKLVREGDNWRVDELTPEFLRSQLKTGLANDDEFDKATGECLGEKLLALDDAELQEVAYGAIGEKQEAQAKFVELVGQCDTGGSSAGGGDGSDADVGFLREKFEEGIAESLEKEGASKEAIECVKRELRKSISDEELTKAIGAGEENIPADVNKAATQAILECDAVGS